MVELQHKATHDQLTGLTNHAFARKTIVERMEAHPDHTFVFMLIDLDNFKQANDTWGHLFGDQVLRYLATQLKDSVRDNDIVARVGGDEFLMCMELNTDPRAPIARIYDSIGGEFEGFKISISMGVALARGESADYDTMFRHADQALYAVKRAGRGQYAFYDDMEDMLVEFDVKDTALSAIDLADLQDEKGATK